MEVYNHLTEDQDNDYDDTLHPEDTKNFALVFATALILAVFAAWIISKMGLYNPN